MGMTIQARAKGLEAMGKQISEDGSATGGPPPLARVSPEDGGLRLQKVIAASGLASRRKAEQLIAQGRVMVNGQVIRELGTRVDPDHDHVKVDGRHLPGVEPHTYVMLNKPKGCVSSLSDPEGRSTIKDLLHGVHVRVFPVGRLDFDTEGLMLLTNHGAMSQALLHPRHHVPKVYLVKLKGVLSEEEIRQLEDGVDLEDGRTNLAIVKKIKKAEENSWIELTIHEGRTHQVKRMLDAVGHRVLRLKRVKFGPLVLGDLPPGEFRYLTDREANALRGVLKRRGAETGETASERSRTETIRPLGPARVSAPYRRSPDRIQRVSGDPRSLSNRPRSQTPSRGPSAAVPGSASRVGRRARPAVEGRDRHAGDRRQPNDSGRVRRSEGPRASVRSQRQAPARPDERRSRSFRGRPGPSKRGASPRRPTGFQRRVRRRP
jgi:23S rRNA pseudouridine2605 synthase